MKKSNLIIGISVASLAIVGFFILKNKKKGTIVETDAEVEFENIDGKSTSTTIKPIKTIKVKYYKSLLLLPSVENLKKNLIGKNIYTSIPNVIVRDKPFIDDIGIFNSVKFKIKNKGSFIGKVADVILEKNSTNYFLAISDEGYNKKLENYLRPFFNPKAKLTRKYYNFVLVNDVVVDL